jgi:hydrogenase expression/formation protein HypD
MKIDLFKDYRNPKAVFELLKILENKINILQKEKKKDLPIRVMEVCGGHTHAIMKYGLNKLLEPLGIEFLHGPGCPVCVMPKERIDHAIALANMENTILTTYGDMLRVPGSKSSLLKERAKGRDIRMVYSPLDVLKIAENNPNKKVIFFAIGFETTSPMTAVLLEQVFTKKLNNVYFHINHVLVVPAMSAVIEDGSLIEAFIGPGHVSAIIGGKAYVPFVEKYKVPVVIAGFEPVDILQALIMIIDQLIKGEAKVEIQYKRVVSWEGNLKAQEYLNKYFEIRESFNWRGLGEIPQSALKLKEDYSFLDAEITFYEILKDIKPSQDHKLCICGEILRGRAKPTDCKVFGKACTPENPLGACMVSSEGVCNAYYRYREI